MIEALFSGKLFSCGKSDVVNASVYSEKTRLEEVDENDDDDDYYFMNKSRFLAGARN